MTEDYDVKCFSGAIRKQSELTRVFNYVAPHGNWKNPINMILPIEFFDKYSITALNDAVVHFTGSMITIHFMEDNFFRVTADGYYKTIGA